MTRGSAKERHATEIRIEIGPALLIVIAIVGTFGAGFSLLHNEIGALRTEMRSEIGALRSEMGVMRSDLQGEISALRSD